MWKELKSLYTAGSDMKWYSHDGKNMEVPQNIKHRMAHVFGSLDC